MKKLAFLLFALACTPTDKPVPAPVTPQDTATVAVPAGEKVVVEAPKPVAPVEEPSTPGFCRPGDPCDWTGDAVLSRVVDPVRSTFRMHPDNKLFAPGDNVTFEVCAKDKDGNPVPGVPAVVVLRVRHEHIAGDGTTLTADNGCRGDLSYTVQDADMIGDPTNGEPDSGSYILDAYAGGRRLLKMNVLHDVN